MSKTIDLPTLEPTLRDLVGFLPDDYEAAIALLKKNGRATDMDDADRKAMVERRAAKIERKFGRAAFRGQDSRQLRTGRVASF